MRSPEAKKPFCYRVQTRNDSPMSTEREAVFDRTPVDELEPLDGGTDYREAAARWLGLFRSTLELIEEGGRDSLAEIRLATTDAFLAANVFIEMLEGAEEVAPNVRWRIYDAQVRHIVRICAEMLGIEGRQTICRSDAVESISHARGFLAHMIGHIETAPSVPLACAEIRQACSWDGRGMREVAGTLGVTAAAISLGANSFRLRAGLEPAVMPYDIGLVGRRQGLEMAGGR